jgi:phospholipase/carboxylesterase
LTNSERLLEIAGLRTIVVGAPDAPMAVVLLHGYAMKPEDLAPFAHSLGVPALFLLPRGPQRCFDAGRYGWWDIDSEARDAALSRGPRDLVEQDPPGLGAARATLEQFVEALAAEYQPHCTVVGGFSQGGMLSLDFVLRSSSRVDALVLMSASRIARADWEPKRERLRGLPAFVSHGRADQDLAFTAGEALRDFMLASGAEVSWAPFEGGHEIPLIVWRGLRKFFSALLRSSQNRRGSRHPVENSVATSADKRMLKR